MKKISAFMFAALLVSGLPCQGASLEDFEASLNSISEVKTDFIITRPFHPITTPLRGEASAILSRELGFVWTQKTPLDLYVIGGRDFIKEDIPGLKSHTFTRENYPQMFGYVDMLQGRLSGSREKLEADFNVVWDDLEGEQWQVTLTPKSERSYKFFKELTASGDRFIRTLDITDKGGDVTQIIFKNTQTGDDVLSDGEKAQFEN